MIQFTNTLKAWGTENFNATLKNEIEQLKADCLPLQQGLTIGNYALDNKVQALVLQVADDPQCIHAKVGIFYTSIISGCSCADDPTPIDENTEYCDVMCIINKQTASTTIQILPTN